MCKNSIFTATRGKSYLVTYTEKKKEKNFAKVEK